MSKITNIIIFLFIFELGYLMFTGLVDESSTMANPYTNSTGGNSNPVWDFFVNPTTWSVSDLLIKLLLIGVVAGAVGIGLFLFTKSDLVLLYPILVLFSGVGAIPIIQLYSLVSSEVAMFACVPGVNCVAATIAAMLSAGVMAVMYFFAVIDWWAARGLN